MVLDRGNPLPDITRDLYAPIMYTFYATDTGIMCTPYEYYGLKKDQYYDAKFETLTLTAYDTGFLCADNDAGSCGFYKKPFYGILEGSAEDQIDSQIQFFDDGTGKTVKLDSIYPSATEDCFKFAIARNRAKVYRPGIVTKYTTSRSSGYYPDSTLHPEYEIKPRNYSFKYMKYVVGVKGLQAREAS